MSSYLDGEGLEESRLRLRPYSSSKSLLLEADLDLAMIQSVVCNSEIQLSPRNPNLMAEG